MPENSASAHPEFNPRSSEPGASAQSLSRPSSPPGERHKTPDWSGRFWGTLEAGLPSVHLLKNPYFPSNEQIKGGWRGLIERVFRPPLDRVDGVTGSGGRWVLTPEQAMEKHAVDSANRLLTEAPMHFTDHPEHTYFCFLDLDYSQVPDWAIIHRREGAIAIGEDLTLCRPDSEVTMVVTIAGPVFGLHRSEIRLWEAVAHKLARAFEAVDEVIDPTSDNTPKKY